MNNLISVIIPAYNRELTIERAIRSVLNQTYTNLEVIVVDDCSIDDTESIVKSIIDKRLVYHKLERNSGACIARNKGVELSRGEYIAFQDSDDEWHTDKLEKQYLYLSENKLDFVTCGFLRIDGVNKMELGLADCPTDRVDLWCKLLNSNWVSTQTILCKRECFDSISFSPEIKRFQDWDLALQASLLFKMGCLKECLVDVYCQDNSITKTVKQGNPLLALIKKHEVDVDFSNKQMVSTYYKCLGDAKRRMLPKEAAADYRTSLAIKYSNKVLLDIILCYTGLIKLYKTRE